MEAQRIRIALHDTSDGYEVSPARVPLSMLRGFIRDTDEFLRGDGREPDTRTLEVAVVDGSLAVLTEPIANPALLTDLRRLTQSELLDNLGARRRAVVERWQKSARANASLFVEITSAFLLGPIVINSRSDYRSDDADQWVRVERYVQGEMYEMGGLTRVNAHIRLPDGKSLVVDTDREVLRSQTTNRLFKPAMVRISADYNVVTREYRNARLIDFVEHDDKLDDKSLDRLIQRGAKAWADVPDSAAWVEALRGHEG